MTGESFHAFVADPSLLDKDSALLLKELNSRYPFFRASQLLLAKNLRDLQHIDQRKQLHRAAVYAADRALLQALLDGRHPLIPEMSAHKEAEKVTHTEVQPSLTRTAPAVPEPVEAERPEKQEMERAHVSGHEQAALPPTPAETEIPEPMEVVTETGETTDVPASNVDRHLDLIPEPVLYRVEDLLKEEPHSEKREEPPAPVSEPEPHALPFDQWLDRLSVQTPQPQSVDRVPQRSTIQNQQSTISRPSLKDNIALIEDFLSSLPKEGQGKRAEFFKPSRAAERSNTPDPEAVSETLANIYMQQGQFGSAAQAFDALAKRFPEKSSYFAARKMEAVQKSSDQ